jgi:hypothetical protein
MGKGSNPRPYTVPREEFRNNFDAIFRKKEHKPSDPEHKQPAPKKDTK